MQHGNSGISHRRALAVVLGLTTLIAVPLAVPSTAIAAPSLVLAQSGVAPTTIWTTVESPADASLRTSRTLAVVAVGTLALVGLWWYLVIRHRRRD